jgi:hypothetical protein
MLSVWTSDVVAPYKIKNSVSKDVSGFEEAVISVPDMDVDLESF